jgi:transposase
MPAPLRVQLNQQEEDTLTELRKAISVPYRTRDRAHMIKLNAQGKNVPEIALFFNCHEHTVRATIRRWETRGLVGLWEKSGRGAKPKWIQEDLEYLENCLTLEERTYNSLQLARKLKQERAVDLSSDRLRRILKKKDIVGKEPDRAIADNKINTSKQLNRLT